MMNFIASTMILYEVYTFPTSHGKLLEKAVFNLPDFNLLEKGYKKKKTISVQLT